MEHLRLQVVEVLAGLLLEAEALHPLDVLIGCAQELGLVLCLCLKFDHWSVLGRCGGEIWSLCLTASQLFPLPYP